MRITPERFEENYNLIRKYLVKCHTDKDGDSLFCRFSELMQHVEDLEGDVRSWKSVADIISKCKSRFQRLQDELGEWADATFGFRTPESLLAHLRTEIEEIIECPTDEHEWADALTLLTDSYRLATGNDTDKLLTACFEKLEINKGRSWHPPDEEGISRHIK